MKQFDDVPSERGAPMGRSNVFKEGDIVHVFEVEMVDGDYDDGGVYWGGPPSEPLFCARGGESEVFTRAPDLQTAIDYLQRDYPELTVWRPNFDVAQMACHYLIAAARAESGDDDALLGPYPPPWTDEARAKAFKDCEDFVHACAQTGITYEELDAWGPEQVGHDLWLSRQRHGAGFWDRGRGELGDRLHAVAESLGTREVWAEDGLSHYN